MREVKGLQLNEAQWLDLLCARTSEGAYRVIQPSRILQQECSAKDARAIVWAVLDEKYSTSQRPGQQLFRAILQGSQITVRDPEAQYMFASACDTAVFMKQRDRRAFASLDEYVTQETTLERLERDLLVKWKEHR